MPALSFADFKKDLAAHFDRVEADRTELVVTRDDHEAMVLMTVSQLEGLKETLHLLGSQANAEHLRRSIAEFEAGHLEEHVLVRP